MRNLQMSFCMNEPEDIKRISGLDFFRHAQGASKGAGSKNRLSTLPVILATLLS